MCASTTTTATSQRGFRGRARWLRDRLDEPCDALGLAAFRFLFGTVMLIAVLRFAGLGWIRDLYATPNFHFTYWGFDWVKPWPLWGLYVHFALMAVSAGALALGFHARLSACAFLLLFTYAELLEKSAYLNHYY